MFSQRLVRSKLDLGEVATANTGWWLELYKNTHALCTRWWGFLYKKTNNYNRWVSRGGGSSSEYVVGLDVGPDLASIGYVAIAFDGGRRIVDVVDLMTNVRQTVGCRSGGRWLRCHHRLQAGDGGVVDDDSAALFPVERAHRHVVVLLLGRQVVRAARNARSAPAHRVADGQHGQRGSQQTTTQRRTHYRAHWRRAAADHRSHRHCVLCSVQAWEKNHQLCGFQSSLFK